MENMPPNSPYSNDGNGMLTGQPPATPTSSGGGLVGFTRHLFNYVSGTPTSSHSSMANADLEQRLSSIEYAKDDNKYGSMSSNGGGMEDMSFGYHAKYQSAMANEMHGPSTAISTPSMQRRTSSIDLASHMKPIAGNGDLDRSAPVLKEEDEQKIPMMSLVSAVDVDAKVQEEAVKGEGVIKSDSIRSAPTLLTTTPSEPCLDDIDEIIDDGEIIVQMRHHFISAGTDKGAVEQASTAAIPAIIEQRPVPIELVAPALQPASLLAEFDPLIPTDWMIKFDSPTSTAVSSSNLTAPSASATVSDPLRPLIPVTPISTSHSSKSNSRRISSLAGLASRPPLFTSNSSNSLIDASLHEIMSPSSVPKYSERDLDMAKKELSESLSNETKKLQRAESENSNLQSVIAEQQEQIQSLTDECKQERQRYKLTIDKHGEEKQRLTGELSKVESALKELRVRYEEVRHLNEHYKKNEVIYKQTIETLQKDIQSSQIRMDTLRTHAEQKLKEANEEIDKVSESGQREISLLNTKLQKSEIKLKSMQQLIEQKQQENSELMTICDDLIKKMEGGSA